MAPIKVASVQNSPVPYDLPASIAKVGALAAEAAQAGAKLAVFPEAFLSCYPRNLDFRIGGRTQESRDWHKKYLASSVKLPPGAVGSLYTTAAAQGSEFWGFSQLTSIAASNSIYLSIGIIESEAGGVRGGTVYCTNLIFGPDGTLLSRHRKLMPTGAERVIWGQGGARNHAGVKEDADGDDDDEAAKKRKPKTTDNLPVVQTPIGRLGALICWENYMPLARYLMFRKGVEIYMAPTADGRESWLPTMRHVAQEGRCFVISANQYVTRETYPATYPGTADGAPIHLDKGADESAAWSKGGSCIVGPLGDVLAGPLWGEDGILYADIDLDDLAGAKLDFDVAGHYGREDLLLGLLNEEAALS